MHAGLGMPNTVPVEVGKKPIWFKWEVAGTGRLACPPLYCKAWDLGEAAFPKNRERTRGNHCGCNKKLGVNVGAILAVAELICMVRTWRKGEECSQYPMYRWSLTLLCLMARL